MMLLVEDATVWRLSSSCVYASAPAPSEEPAEEEAVMERERKKRIPVSPDRGSPCVILEGEKEASTDPAVMTGRCWGTAASSS
jgi:hypothetical protein